MGGMRRTSLLLPVLAAVVLLTGSVLVPKEASSQSCDGPSYATDHIIVKMREGASAESIDRMKGLNGEGKEEESAPGLWVVELPAGLSMPEAVELYAASPDVEYAEPDYLLSTEQGCSGDGAGLEIDLSDSPDPVLVGGELLYKATVRNHGPDVATNMEVTSGAPEGSKLLYSKFTNGDASGRCPPGEDGVIRCGMGDLGVGESATFTMAVRPAEAGTLSGFADAQADNALPGLEASASTTTRVLPAPETRFGACTITGTLRSDVLVGTPARDVICGLGGDDTLAGKEGNDAIFGGAGRDTVVGGSGRDALFGNRGPDTLRARDGVRGNDYVRGGYGDDKIFADPGDDVRTKD